MRFGYLTVIRPTGEKDRTDHIWRCVCDCGKELECTAARLLSGNTLSCGCTGVHRKRGKLEAKITYQKVTYYLGNFESFDGAATARKDAEKLLNDDPRQFLAKFA